MDISFIQPPPPPLVVYRYVGAYPWHTAMNRLIGHTRSNTQATSWGDWEANGRWVASASRGGGVDERTVGGSSATRWDATTSRCEWRQGSRMDIWGSSAMRWYVRTSRQTNKRRGASRQEAAASCKAEAARLKAEAACWEDERRRWHVKRTRGGGGATTGVAQQPSGKQEANGRGGVCRQEVVDPWEDEKQQRCNKKHRDNQLEAPADKRRWHLESRKHLKTMRGGGFAARGQENEAARCKDDRGRWMRWDKRRHDNQPGQTREVNWRWTPRLAVGGQEAEEEGYFSKRWNVCLTKFALLDFML